MSLINKMLRDLEKRGVTPSMAFGNTKDASQESIADQHASTETDSVQTEATSSNKKQPSRLLIYSGLFLLVYLAAYVWITLQGDQAFKQVANPLQAQQYQPKAVQPLHLAQNKTVASPENTGLDAMDEANEVAAEIKAAIAAEIQQADADHEAEVEKMLSEAEAARQDAIQKALQTEVALEKTPTTEKTATRPAKVKEVVSEQAAVKKVAAAPTQVTKPKVAAAKVAKAPVKSPTADKAPMVEKSPIVAKTTATPQALPTSQKGTAPNVKTQLAKNTAAPKNTTPKKTAAPKIVKTVRSEHQAEALYQKALNYVQQGRVSEAQTILSNALDIDPAHQDARQTLAALLLDNQRIKDAKDVLQDGLVVNPNHVAFRMAVARLEVEMGQPNLALDTLMKGNQQAINHADYQAFIGTLLQGQNRHEEAITHFQNALNINRGLSNVLIGMGVSYQALNRLDDAKMAYQQAQSNSRLPNNLKDFLDYRIKEVEQRISSK